jgi:phosphoglycolate phosphatase
MDLETAKNAGMESIAVTWGYHDRERLAGADRIVESVSELISALA